MLRNLRLAQAMWHMKNHANAERDLRFSVSRIGSMLSMLERRHLLLKGKLLLLTTIHCLTTSITLKQLGFIAVCLGSLSLTVTTMNSMCIQTFMCFPPPTNFLEPYSILLSVTEMLPQILGNSWSLISKILHIFKFHSYFCLFRNSLLRIPFFLQISQIVIALLSYCLSQ